MNMKIYSLEPDLDRYSMFVTARESDCGIGTQFDGTALTGIWRPIYVEATTDEENGRPLPLGDFSVIGTVPVFSRRAASELEEILLPNGELLPLITTHGDFYAFNVTRVIDALDEGASAIRYFKSGNLKDVTRYSFRPEALQSSIFKIPQLVRSDVFVTDEFVYRSTRSNLLGFAFRLLYET